MSENARNPEGQAPLHWTGWVVMVLALVIAAWFVVDGVTALTTGDYVTPSTGPYAGQLGPWSKVVAKIGLPPRSTAMKWTFVAYGALWLVVIGAFAVRRAWGWWCMLIAALGAGWYLPFGTLLCAVQILLLLLGPLRRRAVPHIPAASR